MQRDMSTENSSMLSFFFAFPPSPPSLTREVSMWITWGGQARAQAPQPTHFSSWVMGSVTRTGMYR